jgi:ATP-binding cassette subfamily F protein 3
MPLLTGVDLAKGFGAAQVFQGVSFEIQERDRIALVGVNGSGKSTLTRIIAGLETADRGTLSFAAGTRVGYLPQEVSFPPGQTLHVYMMEGFRRLQEIESELLAVEAALGAGGADGALLERHGNLLHEYEFNGGYSYNSRLREVLAGLGIGEERLEQSLDSFSGGQRTRAALARLLLSEQDLLLLDEPTNHLDLAATEWLEGFLIQARQAVVVVSHDRYFLDKVATRTWEMDDGHLDLFTGNYTQFAQQKAERLIRQQKEFAAQQEHIARTESFIRRYKAGQRARQARGRQKHLDRLDRVSRPREQGALRLQIHSTLRSGDTVLATEDLQVAAGLPAPPSHPVSAGQPIVRAAPRGRPVPTERVLFRAPDVEVQRGDRIAVVGPNGAGKTTFLRVITGEVEPAGGRLYIGYGVQLAYYAQAHEQLHAGRTVIGEIQATSPIGEEEARTYLGRFLFSGDDAYKRVSSLSGGERSRLALAKMALGNANLLVLDEPTNHLDIYSRSALEDVLTAFPGTILFVSHDRYLIDALATHVWEVAGGQLKTHIGGWSEYLAARERQQAPGRASSGSGSGTGSGTGSGAGAGAGTGSNGSGAGGSGRGSGNGAAVARTETGRGRTRGGESGAERMSQLEKEMAIGQSRLQALDEELTAASVAGDAGRIAELGNAHVETSRTLARLEEQWLALMEAVDPPDRSTRTTQPEPAT